MLRDDDLYPLTARGVTMTSPTQDPEHAEREQIERDMENESYLNDDLDSIFGSEPSSPILSPVETGTSSPRTNGTSRTRCTEISEIPRLREKHETEGYRDGVTLGKAKFIQEGFDEGYSLGAVLGLRVGKVLGLLEGIVGAVASDGENDEERQKIEGLWKDAKDELSTEKVFSRDLWDEEGIWKWSVPGEGGEDAEVVFEDVVKAHPVLKKWEEVVAGLIERWGIDLNVWEGVDGDDEGIVRKKGVKVVGESKEEVVPAAGKILGVQREKLSW